MTTETYQYTVSVVVLSISLVYISHIICFRKFKKTLAGHSYKPSTMEYKRLENSTDNNKLAIASIVSVFAALFFIIAGKKLWELGTGESQAVLVFIPLTAVLVVYSTLSYARKGHLS